MTDLAVWSYRSCEPMSYLWPANIDKTWATIVTAFNQAKAGEPVVLELTER